MLRMARIGIREIGVASPYFPEKSLREANTCGRETLDMTSLVLMINLT